MKRRRRREICPAATAAAVFLAAAVGACAEGPEETAAFTAARKAVDAQLPAGHAPFQNFQLKHRTGLQGSQAQVVCGEMRVIGDGAAPASTPFVYIWTLDAAVAKPGKAAGELMIMDRLNRLQIGQLAAFCGWASSSGANSWNYFE
jgi:hypothetical protein